MKAFEFFEMGLDPAYDTEFVSPIRIDYNSRKVLPKND